MSDGVIIAGIIGATICVLFICLTIVSYVEHKYPKKSFERPVHTPLPHYEYKRTTKTTDKSEDAP